MVCRRYLIQESDIRQVEILNVQSVSVWCWRRLPIKYKNMSVGTVNKIIDSVFPQISTNFTLAEMIGYAKNLTNISWVIILDSRQIIRQIC